MSLAYEEVKARLKASPQKWLITGVAGFIGSHLLETLLGLDQRVAGLDNLSTGYRNNLEQVKEALTAEQWGRFRFIEGDIRDPATCRSACDGVDYVLHQAALGSVPRSIEDPIPTHEANVDGFIHVLTAAREAKVARFVYASSSSVYGDHPALPKIENETGKLLSPYAATKYINELYSDVFARVYGMEVVGLRYFNVFGARQYPNGAYAAVIPRWFAAFFSGDDVYINGDGKTTRDFCYVANAVQANILAATALNPGAIGRAYNVAAGQYITLNELFELIQMELREVMPEVMSKRPVYRDFRAGDIRHSLADIAASKNLLGYDPEYSVREGLHKTSEWWLTQMTGLKPTAGRRKTKLS